MLRLGGLTHLNPTWFVRLLRPLADHQLGVKNNSRRAAATAACVGIGAVSDVSAGEVALDQFVEEVTRNRLPENTTRVAKFFSS